MFNRSLLIHTCLFSNLLLSACQGEAPPAQAVRPAWVIHAGQETGDLTNQYSGEVRSRYESNIGFRVAGKITARHVNVGDVVKKGQLLASLDPSDAQLQARAAGADVQAAQANLALAQAELARQRQLYEKQFISKSALEMREAEYKTSLARVQQAQSQSAVSAHQTQYTQLLADRAGVVASIQAEPGQVVAAGQTIAQVLDPSSLEVMVAVPESDIQAIHLGMPAQIVLWANNAPFSGKIREISPMANPQTRAFDVRVQCLRCDSKKEAAMNPTTMKLGMTAYVNFASQKLTGIQVPSTAVTHIQQDPSVWVIDTQGKAHIRKVAIGPFTEEGVEILSGLAQGELVAIAGAHTLTEGMPVKPMLVKPAQINSLQFKPLSN